MNSERKMSKNKESIITVKNLTKKFGNFKANDNLSFEVFKGEIFGFLGANGAGKQQLLRSYAALGANFR